MWLVATISDGTVIDIKKVWHSLIFIHGDHLVVSHFFSFWRQGLALSPKLEYRGMISADCNLWVQVILTPQPSE